MDRPLAEKHRVIVRREPLNPLLRRKLEKKPEKWLKYYLEEDFPLPWGNTHKKIIKSAVKAIKSGTSMVVAAPRGDGKTTVLSGMALWAVFTKQVEYPLVVGYTGAAAKRLHRKWLLALSGNPRLQEDYPEITQPFEKAVSRGIAHLTWLLDDPNKKAGPGTDSDGNPRCGADIRVMEGAIVLPDGLGALGALSIGARNLRGLWIGFQNGKTIRPDLILLDDPQDKQVAKSKDLTRKIIETIKGEILSMSGPTTRLVLLAAVTVIKEGDVAESLLDDPDYESIRVSQIVSFPRDFEKNGESRKKWDEWNLVRLECVGESDKPEKDYYKKHTLEMTEGMEVSWTKRLDKQRGDPDCYYSAMYDYYRLGREAFFSERQNAPIKEIQGGYVVTPELILGKVDKDRKGLVVPEQSKIIVTATDLNSYGFHSVTVAYANDQSASVLGYGRYDNGGLPIITDVSNELETKQKVYEALVAIGKQIAGQNYIHKGISVKSGLWVIDGGWHGDVVRRYVDGVGRSVGIPIIMSKGFGWKQYKPYGRNLIGKAGEQWHRSEGPVIGKFVSYNADYWLEVMQRAWLGSLGSPGTISLFEGNHKEFAEQLSRQKLLEKKMGVMGFEWLYSTQPGWHDYSDATYMCYIGASVSGIGCSAGISASELQNRQHGQPERRKVIQKQRRKCKIPLGRM
jgi:hypothetical protein